MFTPPMILALLAGRKWQSRRLAPQPTIPADGCYRVDLGGRQHWHDYWQNGRQAVQRVQLPYAPGDRLWCREPFAQPYRATENNPGCIYRADGPEFHHYTRAAHQWGADAKWTSARHMPKRASRLWLLVNDVRVHRLHDLTIAEAFAEGIGQGVEKVEGGNTITLWPDFQLGPGHSQSDPIWSYRTLWDSINDKPGARWRDNPWIAAITFDVHKGNIDRASQLIDRAL